MHMSGSLHPALPLSMPRTGPGWDHSWGRLWGPRSGPGVEPSVWDPAGCRGAGGWDLRPVAPWAAAEGADRDLGHVAGTLGGCRNAGSGDLGPASVTLGGTCWHAPPMLDNGCCRTRDYRCREVRPAVYNHTLSES